MERSERDELFDLAARHGVQTSYLDIAGVEQTASPERLVQVLRALGLPIDAPRDAATLGQQDARAAWQQRLDPVVVAWDGRGSIVVRIPAATSEADYRLTVTTEQGAILQAVGRLDRGPVVDTRTFEGRAYVARRLPLPENIPIGYHTLEVTTAGGNAIDTALLVCAPRRVYTPLGHAPAAPGHATADPKRARTWGLFVPLYALHSRRSHGIGDFTDLRDLIDWVGDRGGSVVGTLPLLAAFLDDPCEPSPYAPVSRLAWNEIYLDPAALPEVRAVPSLREPWERQAGPPLSSNDLVDFAAVMAEKRAILEAATERCFATGGRRRDDLEAFRRARPEIDEYARFRAVGERLRRPWPQWPDRLRDRDVNDGDFDAQARRYHLYVQWSIHQQLEGLSERARGTGLGLYLDLPVGVHAHGFDTWREPGAFVDGLSTGAPPDTLFAGGQNWAFPPLHPTQLRADRYRHLIEVLRNHLRYAGVLRIDHVMGLHRLYVIPDGAAATEGVYIRYRPEELYAILSIESHRAKAVLIGENLGTVPPAVQHAMDAHGVHGMHVVQYAARADSDRALPPASAGEVASLNTHDMPPFRAFWHGRDIDERRELGWLDEAEAKRDHEERRRTRGALRRFLAEEAALAPDADAPQALRASLLHLARSDARLVLVTLEDLWGEMGSQNIPGTYREHANWCRRARHPMETWREMPEVTGVLAAVDRARRIPLDAATVRHDVARLDADDARAWREGTHERIDTVLGAHPMEHGGERGTYFAVWAPAAERVSVLGDWCGWNPERCPLRLEGDTGIWEGFVPGVEVGDTYKFHVLRQGHAAEKADPVGFRAEVPPRSATIVAKLDHPWGDQAWMDARSQGLDRPLSIYEVHLGSFRRVPEEQNRVLGYRELAVHLADHVERLGFTHVELMPVMEHPTQAGWGGHAPTGFFAPTSRHGSPADLMFLVDLLHQRGIGVILDWGPWRPSGVGHGLTRFDGTPLFERADAPTFDYRRPQVRSFLQSSACYWLETFHADGLRVDALDSMLATEGHDPDAVAFLRRLNETLYRRSPGIQTFAEVSAPWPMVSRPTYVGGLGFGLRWDTSWRHQITSYMTHDPIHRRHHHEVLSARLPRDSSENYVLALPHDEVSDKESLATRMPGDAWQKLANLRLLYGFTWMHPGKKLLFMGQEFGQWQPWAHDRSLDWHLLEDPAHVGVMQWVTDLNRLYRSEPALYELDCGSTEVVGLEWIEAHDAHHSVLSFLRRDRSGESILVVCNFTPVVRHGYRVGVPEGGTWYELLNSDARVYGGSGVGNAGRVDAMPESTHGRPHTLSLTLPPLGVLVLGRRPR